MSRPRRPARVSTATQQTLDAALQEMTDEFIDCRDYGHAWRSWTVTALQGGSFEQLLKCFRCQTTRKRVLGRHGQQTQTGYDYADGYQLQGFGRLTGTDRDQLRLNHIIRMITEPRGGTS